MKILCIDDDPGVLTYLTAALSPNHEVVTASCGEEGLTTFEAKGPFPIVISDIQMPDISGIEVVNKIHASNENTVCILITGQTDFSYARDSVNKGLAIKFLMKPLSITDLRASMEESIALVEENQSS
jgi:YesN/AraC family two-component response regulator